MSGVRDLSGWIAAQPDGAALDHALVNATNAINGLEAGRGEMLRRFEKSGAYKKDGALTVIDWLRVKGKLSGGAAAGRVGTARQLGQLPQTEELLSRGEIGYEHAAAIARAAENVGAATVRKEEKKLLEVAQTMDPGRFAAVAKDFEHRVDADAALAEANRAHSRRYLHLSPPANGSVRVEGLLEAEVGAMLESRLEPFMKPGKDDDRTAGQRRHDALAEALRRAGSGKPTADGSGPRPQLIITASVDTLAGILGAPAGRLESGATIPSATVQRYACDSAISRITGLGELEHEISHASRTIPPATRRALAARDRACVANGCGRPPAWCDGHHLVFWTKGGPTTLENLALVCRRHHRMVHEDGWELRRLAANRWVLVRPVVARARSA